MIPFNRPEITQGDLDLVSDAISGGHCSGNGPFTQWVESRIAEMMGSGTTLLTTSCTHAIELSALLCQLSHGDEVIVPSFTFVSTASAFALNGAKPVFIDSQFDTLNIDPSGIENAITDRTRAICVVHYGGVSCDMTAILDLAERHGLPVIEDNAHGLFAKYEGRYLGTFGVLATQSFHETKNLTCGEGGALVINDPSMVERAEILREKGTNRARFLRGQVDKYTWVDVGSSWVLSDLLAALLKGQIQRAHDINSHRLTAWGRYNEALREWADQYGVLLPVVPDGCEHVGHLYHLRFQTGGQRSRFIEHMRSRGIVCAFHYQPLHLSPVGMKFGGQVGQCPVAEHAGECLVRLPLFNTLSTMDQDRVIDAIHDFVP